MNDLLDQMNVGTQWVLFITLALGALKSLLKAAPLLEPAFANSDWAQLLLKRIEAAVSFAGWMTLIVFLSIVVDPGGVIWVMCVVFLVVMMAIYSLVKRLAKKHPNPVSVSPSVHTSN